LLPEQVLELLELLRVLQAQALREARQPEPAARDRARQIPGAARASSGPPRGPRGDHPPHAPGVARRTVRVRPCSRTRAAAVRQLAGASAVAGLLFAGAGRAPQGVVARPPARLGARARAAENPAAGEARRLDRPGLAIAER